MNTAFDSISIKIASPDQIKDESKQTSCRRRNPAQATEGPFICPEKGTCSCGEVKKAETINYRSFRPEPEGLFCEAIFGPQKDWECNCGKYKRIKHKGMICDRCGVEITQQRVRRDRLGYIQLAAPVSHIWYFKGIPSRIGTFCELSSRDVERVLYFEGFIVVEVTDPECPLEPGQVLTEIEYIEHWNKYRDGFRAGTGAEVIREILSGIDLDEEIKKLTEELAETTSHQKKLKVAKQLKQMADFAEIGQRPEWMILDVIPVIPPDLRPLVPLEGGRFATSDLNDLYRRVINRNNRLRKLIQLRSPEVILRNEKRMLQEAVDAFFDNGRHGRRVTGPGNRPLKSLADVLKGKIGRFRQNLLGKRVDYSGRSVIVVGPELGLHQCGIPKRMAVELFKPFIIERLQAYGHTQTIKRAKHIAEHVDSDSPVWEVVEEVIADHPVLLNRPPTLHRLGIQAFLPVLVEGKSIRIPPLVCKAFNADFDGDQMAVHVPLTVEAQAEAKLLMLSSHNILKPSHGDPIAVPELDMVLGSSFLTKELPEHAADATLLHEAYTTSDPSAFDALREKPWFHRRYTHREEAITAHAAGQLKLHDSLQLFLTSNEDNGKTREPILTTVGRVLFNEVLPPGLEWEDTYSQQELPFFNAEAGGRALSDLIHRCFNELGTRATTEVLEKVQKLAFEYATLSGISPGITDYIIPGNRNELVSQAQAKIANLLGNDAATEREEHENEQIRIWFDAIAEVEDEMFLTLPEEETPLVERGDSRKVHPYVDPNGLEVHNTTVKGFSPVHIMADSGARARKNPFMQISAIIGLKAKQDGTILTEPIKSSYREGLSVLDYFNSTYGSRKGLVDTAMKTAASGYLTRKLVDVAQDVRVTAEDCGTLNSIQKFATKGGDLAFKISGRTAAEDILDPESGDLLVPSGTVISAQMADQIDTLGISVVQVRSVLTCQTDDGVCAKCYGNDLTTNYLVNVGEAVGIIAAQSIGEPGTQLTMRTFHTGGAVEDVSEAQPDRILSKASGTVYFRDFLPDRTVKKMGDLWVAIENRTSLDDSAHKVVQVNRSDCPLQVDEFLSQKQFKENEERYRGFDSKACQYEVTAVLDSRCALNVGDLLSQAEYSNAQKASDFKNFATKQLRVTQVQHTNISVKTGDLLTIEEAQKLREDLQQGFAGQWFSRDLRTGELLTEERLIDVGASSSMESTSDRDSHFERVYRVTESTRADFPFEAGETVPAEDVAPWLTPFDSEPVYVMREEVTIDKDSGKSQQVVFSIGQELTEKAYEDARLEYRAFEIKKLDAVLHETIAVYHPECSLIVGDMLTTKAEVDKERQRIPEIDERLMYYVTRIHHPECNLERGKWLTGSEIQDLVTDYPAFTAVADDFKVEQFYQVSAVNHPDCRWKVNDLLTRRESSECHRQYKGFDVEVCYKVTHVEGDTTSVTVGQCLTETEYNARRNEESALKVTKLYRVVRVHHPELVLEKGQELTASEYRKYERDFTGISLKRVYSVIVDRRKVDKPFPAGDIITKKQYHDAQEEKRGVKYTVTGVYHPNCPHKVEDVLSEDEYFETIAQYFGFEIRKLTLEEVHKQFPGFNVQALKHRVDEVYHPDCPLKQDKLLTSNDKASLSAKYPGIEVTTVETTAQGIEAERMYRVTSVNHPKCPLQVGGLLTQKESSKNRRDYKGFKASRYYEVPHIEDGTTVLKGDQHLDESEYKSLRKKDASLPEKVKRVYYRADEVHHPELNLEVGAELSEEEYKTYNRKYKGFDAELVHQVTEDKREVNEPLEIGTILSPKEYRDLNKANVLIIHTVTKVHHPNCKYAVGTKLSDEEYNEAAKRYPGFEVDELALQMRIKVETTDGNRVKHNISTGYSFSLTEGDSIRQGETLAELHERTANLDIVAGIPRVTELFEARRPKRGEAAEIAEIEGYVRSAGTKAGIPTYRIEHEGHQSRLYQIPDEKRRVAADDWVNAGEPLTDGYLNPHDILSIGRTTIEGVSVEGDEAVWTYLVDEVQKVYGKGTINDKHVETIVRQMLTKIRITEPGDTNFYPNDEVQRKQFERVNSEIIENGGIPATGAPILQSISKASLSTDSFISAASFQQTTKVLTDAAVSGQTDKLFGLKENVILGRLIPAGSGFSSFQNLEVSAIESEISESGDDD